MTLGEAFKLAVEHHRAGRLRDAESMYRRILAQKPDHTHAMYMLAALAHQAGQADDAVDLTSRAISVNPNSADYLAQLGRFLLTAKRFQDAVAPLRRAVALDGSRGECHANLGVALLAVGQSESAVASLERAVSLLPSSPEAHCTLGNALRATGRLDEAISAYRRAASLRADLPGLGHALAAALHAAYRPDEAIQVLEPVLSRAPDDTDVRCLLANALLDGGRTSDAFDALDEAIRRRPEDPKLRQNRLFLLQFQPQYTAGQILAEHRAWNDRFAAPLTRSSPRIGPHERDCDPGRRLRIGYVSPDFREHVLARLELPVFTQHDHERFEFTLYSDVARPDAFTARLRACADRWRDTHTLDDASLAALIYGDEIDVLVDLTMHMTRSRLLTFARRPAPVQVTWLAYPGTTGLDAIDYRISDPHLDPPGPSDSDGYTETTLRLPNTFWCYGTPDADAVSPPPALSAGVITFGCLNNYIKVSDVALDLWSGVLGAVPGSRLMLLASPGGARERVLKRLDRAGVAPERISFVRFQNHVEYLRSYHSIDIALDTVPYNGHTTSLDAMWMGVPVVTRVGQTVVGRAGLSQLTNLGLEELVAHDDDAFVRMGSALATNLTKLESLRGGLRDRMRASPLCDGKRMARALECAYRDVWQRWCRTDVSS